MKYVLSIDGGGIRGIIPALVLAEIEKRTGKSVSELFDLVAGTSTGGILALGLLKDNGLGKAEFSARALVKIYQDRGQEIFSRSLWKGASSAGGLTDEKYSADGLESLLDGYFANAQLGKALTDVMITSYDIENREPLFFKSWKEKYKPVAMRFVARATSAAPTFFEPALVHIGASDKALVDGGVFINNPSVSAYVEAQRKFPNDEIKLISLGTGELTRPIPYDEAKNWGKLGWMLPVLSCIFDGVSDAADYQMKQILGENYIRLQTKLEKASDDMDNTSKGNISLLIEEAETLIEANSLTINNIFPSISTA